MKNNYWYRSVSGGGAGFSSIKMQANAKDDTAVELYQVSKQTPSAHLKGQVQSTKNKLSSLIQKRPDSNHSRKRRRSCDERSDFGDLSLGWSDSSSERFSGNGLKRRCKNDPRQRSLDGLKSEESAIKEQSPSMIVLRLPWTNRLDQICE